jgi:hypothetical protein
MTTADIAIIANTIVDLAIVGAVWNLIRTGKIRLTAPTAAQMQAEQQGQGAPDEPGREAIPA